MAWTLSELRREVRQITGFVSSSQIEDDEIDKFINRFYQNTLPSELNLPSLSSFWEFNTQKNVDKYSNLSSNYTLDNPATINGETAIIYTNAAFFYNDYPQYYQRQNIATGTGTVSNYIGTLSDVPVYAATGITISDSVETFTYTSLLGNTITLTGDLGGTATINRISGSYNITFNSNVLLNNDIYVSYEYYTPQQPCSMLLYGNTVTMRPIPDGVYSIRIAVSSVPAALTTNTSTLVDDSWGKLVSYGASREILNARNSQLAAVNIFEPYMEAKSQASIKFIKQNSAGRVAPSF